MHSTKGQESRDSNSDQVGSSVTDFTSTDTIIKGDANVQGNQHSSRDGDDDEETRGGSLVPKEERTKNIAKLTTTLVLLMIARRIYFEVNDQWLYLRFEKQVLGANFSHINVSVRQHPCLTDENSGAKNPYTDQLNEAQRLTSQFNTWRDLLTLIPAIITNVMFGAYSDYIGRKFFLIISTAGLVFEFIMTWAVCYFDLSLYYLFISQVVGGLSGSGETLFFAIYTYTADNTSEHKSRSVQMVLVSTIMFSVSSASNLATGYTISEYGYMWPMAFASMLGVIALLSFTFILKETMPKQRTIPCISPFGAVKAIFSFYFIKSPSKEYKRRDFIMLCVIFMLFNVSHSIPIRALYLLNEPFCWNSKDLGQIDASAGIVNGLYALVAVRVFKKCLSDQAILVLFLICSAGSNFVFSVAQTSWHIYIAFGLGILQGDVWALMRAVLSTMVPPTRRGSLLASLAVMQVGILRATIAANSALYANTVTLWKGLTYFTSAMLGLFNTFLLIGYMIRKRRIAARNEVHDNITREISEPSGSTEELEMQTLPDNIIETKL